MDLIVKEVGGPKADGRRKATNFELHGNRPGNAACPQVPEAQDLDAGPGSGSLRVDTLGGGGEGSGAQGHPHEGQLAWTQEGRTPGCGDISGAEARRGRGLHPNTGSQEVAHGSLGDRSSRPTRFAAAVAQPAGAPGRAACLPPGSLPSELSGSWLLVCRSGLREGGAWSSDGPE